VFDFGQDREIGEELLPHAGSGRFSGRGFQGTWHFRMLRHVWPRLVKKWFRSHVRLAVQPPASAVASVPRIEPHHRRER
jgi:hypothetical protein